MKRWLNRKLETKQKTVQIKTSKKRLHGNRKHQELEKNKTIRGEFLGEYWLFNR